jgi:transcriptional regulator with XRE-family HTH domain
MVGINVKRLREERGLTQLELADKLGVSRVWIAQIERGAKQPSLTFGAELAEALGVGIDELLKKTPIGEREGAHESI